MPTSSINFLYFGKLAWSDPGRHPTPEGTRKAEGQLPKRRRTIRQGMNPCPTINQTQTKSRRAGPCGLPLAPAETLPERLNIFVIQQTAISG